MKTSANSEQAYEIVHAGLVLVDDASRHVQQSDWPAQVRHDDGVQIHGQASLMGVLSLQREYEFRL